MISSEAGGHVQERRQILTDYAVENRFLRPVGLSRDGKRLLVQTWNATGRTKIRIYRVE